MAWEIRNGKSYFYHSRRIGGHVKKIYVGTGPMAELAAQQIEENKRIRLENRERINAAKAGLKVADRLFEQLKRAPLNQPATESTPEPSPPPSATAQTPPSTDVVARVRELLAARDSDDKAVEEELFQLIERFPALWLTLGDLGKLVHANWLNIVCGKDPMFVEAVNQKLHQLREQFRTKENDPIGRLLVDRILSSWLILSHSEAKMAQMDKADQSTQGFYSRRQQQANRQHLAAIREWMKWQQMSGECDRGADSAAGTVQATGRDGGDAIG